MDVKELLAMTYSQKHRCPQGHVWWFHTLDREQIGYAKRCLEPGCGKAGTVIQVDLVPGQGSWACPALVQDSYVNLEAFYIEDPRRRWSGEADYGVWWTNRPNANRWRVSYIQATGEVYAKELGGLGTVVVLGVVPPDDSQPGRVYYHTLNNILEGWSDQCPRDLSWVRGRLALAQGSDEA